jgi:predicted acyl esterase
VNLPFTEYPPKETTYRKLFLAENKTLVADHGTLTRASTVEYQSDSLKASPAEFTYTFGETTHVMGHGVVKLWLSCHENDDMDVYISLRKVSKSGKVLEHINIPWSALPDTVNTQEDVPNSNTIKVRSTLLNLHCV